MKRILLSTAALAVLASPAFAGDLLPPPPPPPAYAGGVAAPVPAPVAPVAVAPACAGRISCAAVDWTGSWVGGVVQYSTGSVSGNDTDFTPLRQSLRPDVDGFMGGVATGFNYQYNQWIFGVVGDIVGGSVKGSRSDAVPMGFARPDGMFAARFDAEQNWLATARGRLGWSWYDSPFMIYGTAGVAFGDVKMRVSANGVDPTGATFAFQPLSQSQTLVGYAVGAGTEWMLDNRFSIGAEYLYIDLQKANYDQLGIEAGYQTHNFRLNLNYHF
jgi:outer membrane immunogenic protein